MSDRLKEIKKRLSKATPGPWKYDTGNCEVETSDWRISICSQTGNLERDREALAMYDYGDGLPDEVAKLLRFDNDLDMEFIANSRADIEWLVAEIERLQTKLTEIEVNEFLKMTKALSTNLYDDEET